MKKARVLESDDDSDDGTASQPSKRFKANDSKTENVLCKDFDDEPVHLIDNYLCTLESLYPMYDKMVSLYL